MLGFWPANRIRGPAWCLEPPGPVGLSDSLRHPVDVARPAAGGLLLRPGVSVVAGPAWETGGGEAFAHAPHQPFRYQLRCRQDSSDDGAHQRTRERGLSGHILLGLLQIDRSSPNGDLLRRLALPKLLRKYFHGLFNLILRGRRPRAHGFLRSDHGPVCLRRRRHDRIMVPDAVRRPPRPLPVRRLRTVCAADDHWLHLDRQVHGR